VTDAANDSARPWGLAAILIAACSAPGAGALKADANRGEPAPEPAASALPKREYALFTDDGCSVNGVDYGEDHAFVLNGVLCACYDGDQRCLKDREPRCFLHGKWYDQGKSADPAYGRRCDCTNAPQWSCRDLTDEEMLSDRAKGQRRLLILECPEFGRMVTFSPGSSVLSAHDLTKIELFVEELDWTIKRKPLSVVVLEAHADPTEEPGARELAQRRAEGIRAALIKLGVKGHRIDIRNLGTRSVPITNPWLPLCAPNAAFSPGPKVLFWWEW
jgi:outer membrane protein OmpA-like peptidoglycan-associated protein